MNVFSLFGEITLNGIEGVNQKLKGMEGRLDQAGKSMEKAGKKLTMFVTLPLVAAGGAAFKMAGDFDKAFRQVNVMLGASADEAAAYKDRILDISTATGIAAKDVTDAYFQIISAGFRGAESMDSLTVAWEGAAGGAADATSTAAALTKALNIFEKEGVEGATEAMDVFFGIVDSGLLTFEQLARSFPRAASNAAGLKVSIQETGAVLATLTKVLGTTEQAATATDAIFRVLISPSEKLNELYTEWGVRSGPEAIAKFGSLRGVLVKLKEATNGEVTAVRELFNSDEAMKGILPILTSSYDDLGTAIDTVTESTGKGAEAFDEMTKGPGFQWQQMMVEMQNNAITLGDKVAEVFGPVLQAAIDKVSQAVDWFSELSDKQQDNILKWVGVAAAAGPVLVVLGKVTQAAVLMARVSYTTLIPALAKVTTALWAKTTAALAAMAAMGPAGWAQVAVTMGIIAGITGLAINALKDEIDGVAESTNNLTRSHSETSAETARYGNMVDETTGKLRDYNQETDNTATIVDLLRARYQAHGEVVGEVTEAIVAETEAQESNTEAREDAIEAIDQQADAYDRLLAEIQYNDSELGRLGISMDDIYEMLIRSGAAADLVSEAMEAYGNEIVNVGDLLAHLEANGINVISMFKDLEEATIAATSTTPAPTGPASTPGQPVSASGGPSTDWASPNAPDWAGQLDLAEFLWNEGLRQGGSVEGLAQLLHRNAVKIPPAMWNLWDQAVQEAQSLGELQEYANGGMINEPTLLTRVGDSQPFGIMAERGPEPIGWGGGVTITGNTFNVRQESDINAVAEQIVNKIRQKTGAKL
jgi:TP901 family phage tail tape measure protein